MAGSMSGNLYNGYGSVSPNTLMQSQMGSGPNAQVDNGFGMSSSQIMPLILASSLVNQAGQAGRKRKGAAAGSLAGMGAGAGIGALAAAAPGGMTPVMGALLGAGLGGSGGGLLGGLFD